MKSGKRDVLLLNSCEQILRIISWQRAVRLLMSGKATAPYGGENRDVSTHKIKTSRGDYFELPSVIVLVRYYKFPHKDHRPSRKNILKRDKNQCQYCGFHSGNTSLLTLDHVHPRSRGGGNGWTNLVTACKPCNSKKSNRLLKDTQMSLMRKPKKPTYYALHLTGLDEHGKKIWDHWITTDEL